MVLFNEKIPVKYDDAPEVATSSLPEPVSHFDESRQKIIDIDPTQKEAVFSPEHAIPAGQDKEGGKETQPCSICGLSKKMFSGIFLLAVIIIGAAIGGGVGGSIAASRKSYDEAPAADTTSITPSTTSTSMTSTTSSSGTPTPTIFLNNNTLDFGFQSFEGTDYEGQVSQIYDSQGHFDLDFNASSYVWRPNDTRCCVTFCRQSTWIGWWCESRYQPNSSTTFDNIDIGCSGQETGNTSRAICRKNGA